MMTFEQQDKVLREDARRYKLRVIKNRLFPDTWGIYCLAPGIRRAYGTYGELLRFFEGIRFAIDNPSIR